MEKEAVGSFSQAGERFFIVRDDRTSGEISACHDKDVRTTVRAVQKKHVERRIREHHSKPGAEAQPGHGVPVPFCKKHDRPGRACEKLFFSVGDPADAADCLKGTAHESKGLLGPVLSRAQTVYRFRIHGIAGQMDPAQPFDRQYPSCQEQSLGCAERIAFGFPLCGSAHVKCPGTARGTAVRLRVVSAVADL